MMDGTRVGTYTAGHEDVRIQGGPVADGSGLTTFDRATAHQIAVDQASSRDHDAVVMQNDDGSYSVYQTQEMSLNDAWRHDTTMEMHDSDPRVVEFDTSHNYRSNMVHVQQVNQDRSDLQNGIDALRRGDGVGTMDGQTGGNSTNGDLMRRIMNGEDL